MQKQRAIEQLGYKPKEAQVYLAALQLGEAKIAEIADKVKMPRTSVLVIAEKLHRDGLMNYYLKRFCKYWVAESPEKILSKIREEETALEAALPALKALQRHGADGKPTVRVYNGAKEIQLILEDIIETKHDFSGIIAWNDLVVLFGEDYIRDFIATQKDHFLRACILVTNTPTAVALRAGDTKNLRETRFLPTHVKSLNTATFVYGNKVAILSLNPTLPTGFLIDDADVHKTMTIFFEELWNANK